MGAGRRFEVVGLGKGMGMGNGEWGMGKTEADMRPRNARFLTLSHGGGFERSEFRKMVKE